MNAALIEELRSLPGVEVAPSQWTQKPAIWVDGREIVHEHEPWIEIRLTSKLINSLDDDRVLRRARTSDWVMCAARAAYWSVKRSPIDQSVAGE